MAKHNTMKSACTEFDLRAIGLYEAAIRELEMEDYAPCSVFALKVISWFERYWDVAEDYSSFYPSYRFRRKYDFDYVRAFSEYQLLLDERYQLTTDGEQA